MAASCSTSCPTRASWSRSLSRLAPTGPIALGAGIPLFAMDVGHVMNSGPTPEYVPSADGQRFLVNQVLQDPRPTPLRLVLNWAPHQ